MRNFIIEQDANRKPTWAIPQSDTIYNLVLVQNTEKIVTVPTGANFAVFSSTGNFYCKFDGTVEIPSGDIIDGSAGELNPTTRVVTRVSQIHLISSSAIIISIAFYNVPFPIA